MAHEESHQQLWLAHSGKRSNGITCEYWGQWHIGLSVTGVLVISHELWSLGNPTVTKGTQQRGMENISPVTNNQPFLIIPLVGVCALIHVVEGVCVANNNHLTRAPLPSVSRHVVLPLAVARPCAARKTWTMILSEKLISNS